MSDITLDTVETSDAQSNVALLGLSALGIVFGDIGTSPLYTLKTVLLLSGNNTSPAVILGLLSLLIWTIIIVVSIKYVTLAMRIHNNGEGGILALMSMLDTNRHKRSLIIMAGLFGAALLYGDGAITPAISVLSALEGLKIIFPTAEHYVLPATLVILIFLFSLQPLGTKKIGKTFGPIIALWFISLAALVLSGANVADNIFYRLCPPFLIIPMVILATLATIIASQAMISGAFSMTRQAIQLGWLPRLHIKQTSESGYGQIYIGLINWLLMMVTIGLVLFFQTSENLASAYGIAVSGVMLLTSFLLFIAMRNIWQWKLWVSLLVAGLFWIIDIGFLIANMTKLIQGGYVPLLIGIIIYTIMTVWHRGIHQMMATTKKDLTPVPKFLSDIAEDKIPRAPGTAIFLTRTSEDTPPIIAWHVKRNHALHEKILVVNVLVREVPWIEEGQRVALRELGHNFWRVTLYYGFMETLDIPKILLKSPEVAACHLDLFGATYYAGHTVIIYQKGRSRLSLWENALFAFMMRNSRHVSDAFCLPRNHVVEIGRQIVV